MALTKVSTGMLSADAASVDLNIDAGTMFIDASANRVGIGNTSPATALDITGTVTADGLTVLSSSESSLRSADETPFQLVIGNNTASSTSTHGLRVKQLDSGAVHLDAYDGAGEALLLNALTGGNVGIGLSSGISSKLHVNTEMSIGADADNRAIIGYTPSRAYIGTRQSGTNYFDTLNVSGGKVGIGTTSPDTKLHLSDGGTPELRLESTDSSVVTGQSLGDITWESNDVSGGGQGVRAKIHAEAENAGTIYGLAFSTGTGAAPTEKVRITNTGNVGIGTASPNALTHIYGGSSGRAWTPDNADKLALEHSSSAAFDIRTPASEQGLILFSDADARARGILGYAHSSDFMYFNTAGSEAARIDASGRVGINRTPSISNSKLEVGGADDVPLINVEASGVTGGMGIGSTGLQFFHGSSAKMRINSSGNVGIGVSPGVALDINRATSTASYARVGNGGNVQTYMGVAGDNLPVLGTYTNHPLRININTLEVARVDTSGNLLVGTTSSVGSSTAKLEILGAASGGRCINTKVTIDTSANHITFHNGNGQVGSVSTNGTATAYNTSSDQRLKENIVDAPSASDDIDAIQVRSFDWKADGSHQKYGMVAQELVTVAPEAVSQPEDPEEMMGVDYSKLVPMLIKEVQQLRARVAQLEGAN